MRICRLPLVAAVLGLGVACGPPSVELDNELFAVAHSAPHHGDVNVGLGVIPVVAFTEPVDEDSLAENLLFVELEDDGALLPIEVTLFVSNDRLSAELVPGESLEPGVEHRLMIDEALEAESGAHLAAPYRSAFVTGDQ